MKGSRAGCNIRYDAILWLQDCRALFRMAALQTHQAKRRPREQPFPAALGAEGSWGCGRSRFCGFAGQSYILHDAGLHVSNLAGQLFFYTQSQVEVIN